MVYTTLSVMCSCLTAVESLRCSSTKGLRTPLWRSGTRAHRTASFAGLDRPIPIVKKTNKYKIKNKSISQAWFLKLHHDDILIIQIVSCIIQCSAEYHIIILVLKRTDYCFIILKHTEI